MVLLLTRAEAEQLVHFLDDLSDKYGNAGCNDYDLDNTDENWALWQEAYKDDPDRDMERPPLKQKLFCADFIIVEHLKAKVAAAISEQKL